MPSHPSIPIDLIIQRMNEGLDELSKPENRAKRLEAETEKRREEFVKKAMASEFSRKQALFLFEQFEQVREREKLLLYQVL